MPGDHGQDHEQAHDRGHEHGDHGQDHEQAHDRGHEHGHGHGHNHGDHALIVDRLPAGAWRIDPQGSEVLFKARAFGFLPVTAIFEEFRGEMSVDAAGHVGGRLVIRTASVNSGWARRDTRLRGTAYLDAERHPEMTFTLESIEPSGSEHQQLSGSLQIQHRSVPLEFPVQVIAHGDHLHLEGQVMVDHDLAGLGWSKPFFVAGRLRLEAALTLTRAPSALTPD